MISSEILQKIMMIEIISLSVDRHLIRRECGPSRNKKEKYVIVVNIVHV